ncbi:MAG: T9SS type A sorting domain-containing protein, partial [Ginsengibacter sp.]
VKGNLCKSGTSSFVHNNGTMLFDGGTTAQNYASASEVSFNNVINNNLNTSTGLSVNNDMAIVGQLSLNANSKITLTSGNITLKSSATSTANLAEVPPTATIAYGSGLFIVERYFSVKRAWRFLSVPVSNPTLTFHQAWQENQSQGTSDQTSPSGYGTQISGGVTPTVLNGFDYYSSGGASVKTYDPNINNWIGITSTNNPIETTSGIMAFIRGDRSAVGLYATATTTVLRTKGTLKVWNQAVIPVTAGKFASIGNPYASALDMRKISIAGGIDRTFYIWDPKLTSPLGLGAYQTFKFIGNDFYPTPGFGSYGNPSLAYNYIQSGQAFFVTATGLNGSITIMENAKANVDSPSVNNTSVFRSMASQIQLLRTTLYSVSPDGTADVMDGVLNLFDDNFSNAIDGKDAIKATNFSASLAIKKEDKSLAVEARNAIAKNDTIFYTISQVKAAAYRLEVIADNLAAPGITAFLEDTYLNTSTPIDLNRSTLYSFNVTSDPVSANPGRFRVVFKNAIQGPLPITFSFVKAYEQNMNISVEWKIENEKNIKEYTVEKSVDGQHFTTTATIKAKGNSNNTVNYQWIDASPVSGNNYYRIRSVDVNGQIQYSTIVKVTTGRSKPQIAVYPNPIANDIVSLQLINQPKGKYYIRLLNNAGQVILITQLQHEQGSSAQNIQINKAIDNGNYLLEVTGADKNKTILKVSK